MPPLKLSVLEIFCAVVEEGTMAAAARRSHCVPSNVATRIKELEGMLEQPLFERDKGQISPTPFARIFYREARDLLNRAQSLSNQYDKDAMVGLLKVGALDVAMLDYLPATLPGFLKRHARTEVSLLCRPSATLEQMLGAGDIDVALTDGPIVHPLFDSCPAYDESLYLVTRRDASKTPGALRDATVFLYSDDCFFRPHFKAWLAGQGIADPRIQTIESYDVIASCVAQGLGISCFPGGIVTRMDAEKANIEFTAARGLSASGVYFVWRRNGMTGLLSRFIEHVSGAGVPH